VSDSSRASAFPPRSSAPNSILDREGEGGEDEDRGVQTSSVSSTSYPYIPFTQESPVWPVKNSANIPALGYLVGPTIGSLLYSATHPSLARGSPSPLEVMDKAFYDHIKANRASPAFQSVNNPAPDFYGEKVCPLSCRHHIKSNFT